MSLAACSSKDNASEGSQAAASVSAGAGAAGDGAARPVFFKRRAAPGEKLPSDYSLQACSGVAPDTSATAGLKECNDICGAAHCVEADNAGGPMVILPDCTASSGGAGKCIPDRIIELSGKFVWKKCDADGLAGVCIPSCLVLDSGAVWLSQYSCNDGELCVACNEDACGDRCSGARPTFRP
jgi:hypothetical protein